MKVFVVTWGSGVADYEFEAPISTYCGCSGVFTDRKNAEKAMTEECEKTIDSLYESYEETDREDEDSRPWVADRTNHQVYGKPEEDYLEINWGVDEEADTERGEYYFRIEEKNIEVA